MRNELMVSAIGLAMGCACAFGAEDKPVELFPVIQDGKWGYMDKSGKLAIKPEYDMAWDFSEGLASVQVGMQRGYIDAQGAMAIKPQFDLSRPFSEGVAAVYTGAAKAGNFIVFNRGSGNWVYIDKTGRVVFKPIQPLNGAPVSGAVGEFHDGHAKISYMAGWMKEPHPAFLTKEGKACLILGRQEPGQEVAYAGRYSEGLAFFQLGKKFGYVDVANKAAIPPNYEDAGDFSEGLAPVVLMVDINDPARTTTWTKAGKYNLGARNGAERAWGTNSIPMDDGDAVALGATKTFVFSVTAPLKQGKYNFQWQLQAGRGFGDLSSNVVVTVVTSAPVAPAADAPQTDAAAPAAAAASAAPAPGKRAENGARWVSQSVPAVMSTGQTYTVSVTMKNTGPRESKWGYIDSKGKIVIAPQFQGARQFSEGLAGVCVEKKWGYVDKTGKMAINPQYDSANPFSEGLARVVVAAKHGFIDATGKMAIEPKFDYAWEFSRGLARVAVGDNATAKEGYVDKTGKYVWEPKESVYGPVKSEVKPESSATK